VRYASEGMDESIGSTDDVISPEAVFDVPKQRPDGAAPAAGDATHSVPDIVRDILKPGSRFAAVAVAALARKRARETGSYKKAARLPHARVGEQDAGTGGESKLSRVADPPHAAPRQVHLRDEVLALARRSSEAFQAGRVYDRFAFGRTLGKGIFSTVIEGVDKVTGAKVAIKVIQRPKAMTIKQECVLMNEVDILRTISTKIRHPNLCRVLSVYRDEGRVFIIMRLCTGACAGPLLSVGSFVEQFCPRRRRVV